MLKKDSIQIKSIDHLVMTVNSIEKTLHFYHVILGLESFTFKEGRKALLVGQQKINLHDSKHPFDPRAEHPLPGSLDICFLTDTLLSSVIKHLHNHNVPIIEGPVERTGAQGKILSVYIRDPDKNLVEIANQL